MGARVLGLVGRFSPLPNLKVVSIVLSFCGLGLLDDFFDEDDVFLGRARWSDPVVGILAARSAASFVVDEPDTLRPTTARSDMFLGGTGGLGPRRARSG